MKSEGKKCCETQTKEQWSESVKKSGGKVIKDRHQNLQQVTPGQTGSMKTRKGM